MQTSILQRKARCVAQLNMTLQTFQEKLGAHIGQPLSLASALRPFGFAMASEASPHLLNGHLIDYLGECLQDQKAELDWVEVITACYELGLDSAGELLDHLPEVLVFSRIAGQHNSTPVS